MVSCQLVERIIARSPLLTLKEKEMLKLVAMGRADKEIASELKVSEHTVKAHLQNIRVKLGASNRTHCVSIAISRVLDEWYAEETNLRSLTFGGPPPNGSRGRETLSPTKRPDR